MMARISIPNNYARAVDRVKGGWLVWLSTPDFIHGTHLMLHNDGKCERVVVRDDEGDEHFLVRGSD